jgi:AbrB family looped-hinge helix DNA binding protein
MDRTFKDNMPEITTTLQIDKAGRINIPRYIRDALELAGGDLVKITLAKEALEGKQGNTEVSPLT